MEKIYSLIDGFDANTYRGRNVLETQDECKFHKLTNTLQITRTLSNLQVIKQAHYNNDIPILHPIW